MRTSMAVHAGEGENQGIHLDGIAVAPCTTPWVSYMPYNGAYHRLQARG